MVLVSISVLCQEKVQAKHGLFLDIVPTCMNSGQRMSHTRKRMI